MDNYLERLQYCFYKFLNLSCRLLGFVGNTFGITNLLYLFWITGFQIKISQKLCFLLKKLKVGIFSLTNLNQFSKVVNFFKFKLVSHDVSFEVLLTRLLKVKTDEFVKPFASIQCPNCKLEIPFSLIKPFINNFKVNHRGPYLHEALFLKMDLPFGFFFQIHPGDR